MSVEVQIKTIRKYQKGAEMAYKKPEVVAKSESKQSFVAGCPQISRKGAPTRPSACKEYWI